MHLYESHMTRLPPSPFRDVIPSQSSLGELGLEGAVRKSFIFSSYFCFVSDGTCGSRGRTGLRLRKHNANVFVCIYHIHSDSRLQDQKFCLGFFVFFLDPTQQIQSFRVVLLFDAAQLTYLTKYLIQANNICTYLRIYSVCLSVFVVSLKRHPATTFAKDTRSFNLFIQILKYPEPSRSPDDSDDICSRDFFVIASLKYTCLNAIQ